VCIRQSIGLHCTVTMFQGSHEWPHTCWCWHDLHLSARPRQINIVSHMRSNKYKLANHRICIDDVRFFQGAFTV
jgi:hypothetical protein